MVLLKIYKLEDTDEKEPISDLSCGEHIIGMGALLQCNDKRVSRKHAVINVGEEKATITSVHVNPCYYMSSQGKNMIILPKDEPVDLNDNDKFALLTDLYWFKVKLLMEEAKQNGDGSRTPSPDQLFSKRAADLDEAGTSKRIRLSFDEDNAVNDETHASDESLDLMTAGENQVTPVKEVKEEDIENNITVKEEISSQNNIIKEENDQELDKEEIKQEASQHINDTVKDEPQTSQDPPAVNQPSTSNPRRERCWYGANCFRKNPTHKTDFSHPGDDDYNSDPNDDRPFCPYGLACYRKNRDHRRDYRHSAANVPPPRGGNGNRFCQFCEQQTKKLTGVNLDSTKISIVEKIEKIIDYGRKKKICIEHTDRYQTCIFIYAKLFKEDCSKLFIKQECYNEAINYYKPCIVEKSSEANTDFEVFFQNEPVFYAKSFIEALLVCFGMYFIFNLIYPKDVAATLEMLQRFHMKIHPDSGTRAKTNSKPKVLTLMKNLSKLF